MHARRSPYVDLAARSLRLADDLRTHVRASADQADELERSVELEEVKVAEEELRTTIGELERLNAQADVDREHYKIFFHEAPLPYLVTDPLGIVREVNIARCGS
jgi:hypothetical protein